MQAQRQQKGTPTPEHKTYVSSTDTPAEVHKAHAEQAVSAYFLLYTIRTRRCQDGKNHNRKNHKIVLAPPRHFLYLIGHTMQVYPELK
jgi:hypothetical protein